MEKDSGKFLSSGRIIPERIFSRMCILEKQYSSLECLSITSWKCFMHSPPLRDSDPDRIEREEDMPPVGLP